MALALRLVRTSAAARTAIAGRFRYILVDEFQDTNRAQAELVAALADGHRNVTVVGDDDQAIYAFRGAAVDNILAFGDRYPGGRTVVLRRNYRSLAPVLDAAYRLVRFNDPDRLEVRAGIVKRLRAQRVSPAPAPVRLEVFASGAEEADWLAAEIGRRIEDGAAPRDHAILVRANGHADPILRALNMAGIPWRFSGTSGLYARPEVRLLLAFLRAVADLESSVDVYALAASDVYGLGGEDLTAIVNMARRRNRSVWAILDEVDRQPGILRLTRETRAAVHRLVADLRGYAEAAHAGPAGELLYRFLRASGILARLVGTDTPAAEEQLQNIARFFEIVRSQSALLADDRAVFVAQHLATLIEAGDDPATAELDPDADAVAVLTVHKAKGLEFPVVFLPGMVAGRFPSGGRGDALALPAGLGRGLPPTPDLALAEERRLCYVAMTRARDELILSHAADYGGARARRVSPFVLEALDLPAAAGVPGRRGARDDAARAPRDVRGQRCHPGRAERPDHRAAVAELLPGRRLPDLPAQVQVRPRPARPARPAPRDRLRRGAPQGRPALPSPAREGPRHERDRARRGLRLGLVERGLHEPRPRGSAADRRARGTAPLPRGAAPARRRHPDLCRARVQLHPRWRPGPRPLGPRGRRADRGRAARRLAGEATAQSADVVSPTLGILGPERVTITDYKSSDVRDPAKARQRARDSLQLQIYAMGYEAMTGRLPDAIALHFLESGLVGKVEVDPKRLAKAREKIAGAAAGMRARDYTPRPDYLACTYCAFRDICPSSVAR